MNHCRVIAAMGTPLTDDEALHIEGFERHLDDVCDAKIDAILVAGTMGNMQLLSDATYRELAQRTNELAHGRCEVFIGAGDTSFVRTRDRIRWLNQYRFDGIAVLTPYFARYTQNEFVAYFSALADESRWPIYLYDLPVKTGVALEIETVLRVAKHPNVAGIKCSGDLGWARHLYEQRPKGFRVQVAQANLLDLLIQAGIPEHVDGVFALAPHWTAAIRDAALAGQTERAQSLQFKLSNLLRLLLQYGIFPTFTALMNARGIPGCFAPKPAAALAEQTHAELLSHPLVTELVQATPSTTNRSGHLTTGV